MSLRLNLGCGAYPASGWVNVDLQHKSADILWDITDGLPPVEEPIDRIYAGHVLEHIDKELVPHVLQSWIDHPQVSNRTLMAVVGPDCDKALQWVKKGHMTQEAYEDMVSGNNGHVPGEGHLWRSTGAETYHLLRDAGWAAAHPYDLGMLALDGWPLTSQVAWQFGALCRAIK